jgi:hypothetical protein
VVVTRTIELLVKKIKPLREIPEQRRCGEKDENRIGKSRKKRKKRSIAFVCYDSVKKLKEIGKIASVAHNCDDGTAITVPRIAKVGE